MNGVLIINPGAAPRPFIVRVPTLYDGPCVQCTEGLQWRSAGCSAATQYSDARYCDTQSSDTVQ
eukprot:6106317-Pyramimonas_sp.AAC.2